MAWELWYESFTANNQQQQRMRSCAQRLMQDSTYRAFTSWRQTTYEIQSQLYHAKVALLKLQMGAVARAFAQWADILDDGARRMAALKRAAMKLMQRSLALALAGWRARCDAVQHQRTVMAQASKAMMNRQLYSAFNTWYDSASTEEYQKEVMTRYLRRVVKYKMARAWTVWQNMARRAFLAQMANAAGLRSLVYAAGRLLTASMTNSLRIWRLNLIATRSQSLLKASSDAAGQGLIKVLRSKEHDLQAVMRRTSGVYLMRDSYSRCRRANIHRLVHYWRTNMNWLTQRVLHDAILMQEQLETIGRKLWLRAVRETTRRWYRDALRQSATVCLRNWILNINLAIQNIDIATFQLINNSHMLQSYRAGAYHLGKAILRWRNKKIQTLVRRWKDRGSQMCSQVLTEALLLHEAAEIIGRRLWLRVIVEVSKRWHREAIIRKLWSWRLKSVYELAKEIRLFSGLQHVGNILWFWKVKSLQTVQRRYKMNMREDQGRKRLAMANRAAGLRMMQKIMKSWADNEKGRVIACIRQGYQAYLADIALGGAEAMKAAMMQLQEDELLSRVKKMTKRT